LEAFVEKQIFGQFLEHAFQQLRDVRAAGQAEYAGGEDAFGNFNRLAEELGVSREAILWVYAMKHKDGIASHIRGQVLQREPVQGRIKDLIMYLLLLWGMEEENLIRLAQQDAGHYGEPTTP
jgi:hypothetical protein